MPPAHRGNVLAALDARDARLGRMYESALWALAQKENPERHVCAAHQIRELMEKYAWYLTDATRTKVTPLKEEVQQLRQAHETIGHSARLPEGAVIDKKLAAFLTTLSSFLTITASISDTKADQLRDTLRSLDPSGRPTSRVLEDISVGRWRIADDYFQAIAHHRRPAASDEEFYEHLRIIEELLSEQVTPSTWPNRDALDALIQSGEGK